ncbi:hypothetical protein AWC38_SpisGene12251 [Stylophora pistillata]|uniref:Uncharacterized protein n=1 Tax=Stylophora pistillata TaxID=50429 RepID=A0A2B4S3T5_STYPI|nr:hypothetical protein AWC38_SpisGene12251 [Stylophora pistillata]
MRRSAHAHDMHVYPPFCTESRIPVCHLNRRRVREAWTKVLIGKRVVLFIFPRVLQCHQPGHYSLLGDSHSTPLPAVTINCLLSKDSELQTVGAALVSNIATVKIHEDIALECSTAVIELLTRNVSPETEHNYLYTLRRFMDYNSEVAGLVSVMGVNVGKYKERSSDIDELCRDLEKSLSYNQSKSLRLWIMKDSYV